jgi:Tfp pilus assembly protein PilF
MRRGSARVAGPLLGLLAASAVASPRAERFAFATLDNGASVGFALLRAGGPPSGNTIEEVAEARSNSVSRVLVDQASGAYFGYRLEVERLSGKTQFRVTVKPLASGVEQDLRRRPGCPNCPALRLLAPPRYPAPRTLVDGDVFTLDLLVNPTTGEKIVDAVKVSSATIAPDAMAALAARLTEALAAVQKADGLALRGVNEAAAAEYERALAIHPNDAVVRNKLGTCLQRSQRVNEAEKQYEEALRINPNYAEAWNNLGTVQHGRGKYKQAIKDYQKATSLKPTLASAFKNMGSAYFAISRFDAGLEAFQAAYRLDPTILESPAGIVIQSAGASAATQSYYFAKICAAAGQLEQALEFLRKAVAAGFRDYYRISQDPDLKVLRDDPRYRQLVRDHPPR